ncbi:tail fiber assembly protein [Sodalis endosymbiont of Spalangia cameroni]|uniref:tail fiber assembly protein n=1 Tax=Sodalis praecaptivus TaxID=1239307 RepID=UPI0031F83575
MHKYSTDIPTAILDDNGLCHTPGWLTVYHAHPLTREYLSASYEYLPAGVGLPAHSYADKPALPKNTEALLRASKGDKWECVPDYRGQTAWDITTRQAVDITEAGKLASHLTLMAPASEYDVWEGKRWINDVAAQQAAIQNVARAEKTQRLDVAGQKITSLERAIKLNMATQAEIDALKAWETYSVLLNRVDITQAPDIDWPTPPDEEA